MTHLWVKHMYGVCTTYVYLPVSRHRAFVVLLFSFLYWPFHGTFPAIFSPQRSSASIIFTCEKSTMPPWWHHVRRTSYLRQYSSDSLSSTCSHLPNNITGAETMAVDVLYHRHTARHPSSYGTWYIVQFVVVRALSCASLELWSD